MNHHENYNQKYLDLAIESLGRSKGITFELVLVSSAIEEPKVPSWVKLHRVPRETRGNVSDNLGHRLADPGSKYFMSANDDIIFSQYALAEMVDVVGENRLIVNPLSNCDNGWMYHADIKIQQNQGLLRPQRVMKREDIVGFEEGIVYYPVQSRVLLQVPYLCMYATLMSRKIWDEVGEIDANFQLGWSDTDYSLRCREKGIMCGIVLSAFIFHFSGATTKNTSNDAIRLQDKQYFSKKWNISIEDMETGRL